MTHSMEFGATRGLARALLWLCAAVLSLCVQLPTVAHAREVPALSAHVNDTAGMLSPDERTRLEQKLSDYEHKTGRQFALLTVDSLDGDDLEGFSIRVAEAWKLGQKGKDNGLVLLLVKNDHKLRIEIGYGLEGNVTDAFSSRVIRNVLVPAMRAGTVASGVDQAFDALMAQAAGEDVPQSVLKDPSAEPHGPGGPSIIGWLVLLLFLAPVLIPVLLFRTVAGRRRGGFWGGGGFGGGGFGGGGGGGFSGGGGGFGGGGSSGSW